MNKLLKGPKLQGALGGIQPCPVIQALTGYARVIFC